MTVNRQINERMRRHLNFPRLIDAFDKPIVVTLSKVDNVVQRQPRFVSPIAFNITRKQLTTINSSSRPLGFNDLFELRDLENGQIPVSRNSSRGVFE
jgi:hypothetical protein